jgi:hypothetical protein
MIPSHCDRELSFAMPGSLQEQVAPPVHIFVFRVIRITAIPTSLV